MTKMGTGRSLVFSFCFKIENIQIKDDEYKKCLCVSESGRGEEGGGGGEGGMW